MQYALLDNNMRVCDVVQMDENTTWLYPDGFTLVEADSFTPDANQEYANYVYHDGEFILDPESINLSTTLDDLIAAKVDEAMQASETRLMASMKADLKASKL